jgi:predicted nucleic acid-binding protein
VRIAIDTNCLIGAVTNPSGPCARIIDAWVDGRVEVVASEATVREAELVLGSGWLCQVAGAASVAGLLDRLRTQTTWVEDPIQPASL